MLLIDNYLIHISLDNQIMIVTLKEELQNESTESRKAGVEFIRSLVYEHKPHGLIFDHRNSNFRFSKESQIWFDTQIVPSYAKLGYKRWAWVVGSDFLHQLSMMQLANLPNSDKLMETRFFDSVEDAMNWTCNYLEDIDTMQNCV